MRVFWLLLLLAIGCSGPVAQRASDGSARSDRFVVYFGVLPVSMTREAAAVHTQRPDAHRPATAPGPDTHHLVVAVFDAGSGNRISNAELLARYVPPNGMPTTKALEPMRIGETISYGNTFSLSEGRGQRFEVEIRDGKVIEHFTYVYDNLHGNP